MTAASLNDIQGCRVERDGLTYEVVDLKQANGVNMVGLRSTCGHLLYVAAPVFSAQFWSVA